MEKLEQWKTTKKKLKFTNKDIANASGIPLSTVEQVMCGKIKSPRLDTVEAIDKALGLAPATDWVEDNKTLGVGKRKIFVSEKEYEWLELMSEVIRTLYSP